MYITLSSKNEPSNSRFTNKFLDNIVLPPNSTVSLISATINQTNIEEKIVVPANSYIYLRIDGWNIIRLQPNTADTTYSKQEFINRLNTLLSTNKPYGINIVLEIDNNDKIKIHFYAEVDYDYKVNFMSYIWGSNIRPQEWEKAIGKASTVNVMGASNSTSSSAPLQFNPTEQSLALPSQYSYLITDVLQDLFIQTNNVSHAFNRAKVFDYHGDLENTIYDSFGIVNAPRSNLGENIANKWVVNWGVSSYNRDVNEYSKVPGDFINLSANYKEQLSLSGDYSLELKIWDNSISDWEIVNDTYGPGDVIQHYLVNTANAEPPPNGAQLYNSLWRKTQQYNMVYYLPLSLNHVLALTNLYGVLRLEHEPADGFLQIQSEMGNIGPDFINYMGYSNSNHTACNKAIGVCSGYGQYDGNENLANLTPQFIAAKAGIEISIDTTETQDFFNDLPQLLRRDPADGVGVDQTLKGRVSLTNYSIRSNNSLGICIYFKPLDDSAYNTEITNFEYGLLGGVDSIGVDRAMVIIKTGQPVSGDINIFPSKSTSLGGAGVSLELLDAGLTRINITKGERYGMVMTFTKADNTLNVTMWEINATFTSATKYSGSLVVDPATFDFLPDYTCLGGPRGGAGNSAAYYFAGSIGQYRLYNFKDDTTVGTIPASPSGPSFVDALGSQYIGQYIDILETCFGLRTTIFNKQDRKYAITGNHEYTSGDETNNYCPVFFNVIGAGQTMTNVTYYPDLVDIFNIPNVILPFDDNYRGTSALSTEAYTGNGSGIILTNEYVDIFSVDNEDEENQREISEYNWYNPGEANPYSNIGLSVSSTVIRDQNLRICIDNLPHRTLSGATGNLSKCIYQIGMNADMSLVENIKTTSLSVPMKIPIQLNNAGEIIINQFDVVIRDENEIEETNMENSTVVCIEIG